MYMLGSVQGFLVKIRRVTWLAIMPQGDAIIKVTSSCICGSDLHLYLNAMPGMEKNAIMGHEVSIERMRRF